jgi:NarL family two-component system response regulator LiaR
MTGKAKDKIRVLIVDDHQIVREGLKNFLGIQEDIQVVGEAGDGEDGLKQAQKLQPDVILMDLVLPKMDGITAIKKIHETHPGIRIIALTSFSEDDKVFPAIRSGAVGYLLKDVSPAELVETIRAAFRGEKRLHPKITEKLVENIALERTKPAPDELTERELEVLGCIAKGLSNQEIGDALFISEKTVKTHVSNILSKLNLDDRTQAAIYAIKKGLG